MLLSLDFERPQAAGSADSRRATMSRPRRGRLI